MSHSCKAEKRETPHVSKRRLWCWDGWALAVIANMMAEYLAYKDGRQLPCFQRHAFVLSVQEDGRTRELSSDITLVDLAGSERAESTGATGARLQDCN